MDFALTDEQRQIVEMAEGFAADRLAPNTARWDAEAHFPVAEMREAAALGLAGVFVDPEQGGSGLGRLDGALIFEALAKGCVATSAFLTIHNMVGWMIDRFGDAEQRARLLPKLCAMDMIASYCLTEPGAGSDAAALRTSARREGDAYVLNGAKAFISGAGASDLYAVMVRTGGPGAAGVSCVLVEKGTPGMSFGRPEDKMGWNCQPTATVTFEDCRIPVENRLGAEGEGFRFAMKGLDGGRINIAACSLGGAAWALEAALAHVRDRQAFGKPLAAQQAVQFMLAEMATKLEASRLMVWRAAAALDAGAPDATMRSAMAKQFATDACFDVVDAALQLHGGYGYVKATGVEQRLRDLRVHRILEGANEIMRLIVSRKLLETA
ncbi:MAG: acyl-CoA dehydrogenase family protein [Rubrimonas sp.]|uniref:acyl-CoA dehydrogenase family protein n=1 Tax=Rubrimonas sp. TaxID=2036015 RepID=UPI002FDD4FC0